MPFAANHFLAKTPFIKLLPPLITGIAWQWYYPVSVITWYLTLAVFLFLLMAFRFLPVYRRYRLAAVRTFLLAGLLTGAGAVLTWHNNILNQSAHYANYYREQDPYIATLLEAPVEKTNSYKALVRIEALVQDSVFRKTEGKAILYFKKDSSINSLQYGSQIVSTQPLQAIKNSGNPGTFDYKRYLLFQQTTAQVYIPTGKFAVLTTTNTSWLHQQLLHIRAKVLHVIKTNIANQKEAGLAEAMLIGYKDDLDKTLLESYTNTGVVHIIAVSGMHLGLIYWILNKLFNPLLKHRRTKWLHPLLITGILWLFTLLTGGAASIMRAAVMFTCILIGKTFNKQSSVYNMLAMSAFLLLCYNPFWLWDVGFQLSYAALLSIVVFYKPVYNLLYFRNKVLDYAWQLIAVTLAAQVLTTPVSLYHFHQFPVYFLFTNLIAVPVSSIILVGELLLLLLAPLPVVAHWLGFALQQCIFLLNNYISWVETLPMALWEGFQISLLQVVLLFVTIAGCASWWLHRLKRPFFIGLTALLSFVLLRFYSFYETARQQKIIVYNVSKMSAVDFIEGHNFYFTGDGSLLADGPARNFHLNPSRILHRTGPDDTLKSLSGRDQQFVFGNTSVLFVSTALTAYHPSQPLPVDLLVLSQNPKLYVNQLTEKIRARQVVIDGSVPYRKALRWKQAFDSLQVPCHSVNEQGAFVMNLR